MIKNMCTLDPSICHSLPTVSYVRQTVPERTPKSPLAKNEERTGRRLPRFYPVIKPNKAVNPKVRICYLECGDINFNSFKTK